MNKKETIEFIQKYKDCIYRMGRSADELLAIDEDRFIEILDNSSFYESDIIVAADGKTTYFRIFDFNPNFSKKQSAILSGVYHIDMNKKNIIDRKYKIQNIMK